MEDEYINIKMQIVIKRQDLFDNMKELGLKINKQNERKYISALKAVRCRVSGAFCKLPNDKEDLLMYGLEFE